MAQTIAQNLVLAPAFIAAAERIVAPEPATAPKSEHSMLPTPCERTIFFVLQFVFVRESTTRFVKRLSDVQTIAIISAGIKSVLMFEKSAHITLGSFDVTPPTVGKSKL